MDEKMKPTWVKAVMWLGVLLVAGSLFSLSQWDDPLAGGELVTIEVPGDERLVGTYWPGTDDRGVLLLEGFGSDQTALRPIATNFANSGYHVLSFDFSGHGRSPGGLDFDNASTDRMAKQVLAAEAKLRELSGLSPDQITFLGHSLGARVALQAATMMEAPPELLILLGTQVNLGTNTQAEFFTGTQDGELAWVQALGPHNPDTNIILLSGTRDDILTPEAAQLLMEKLSETELGDDKQIYVTQVEPLRQLFFHPGLLHNYEIYSGTFLIPWKIYEARLRTPLEIVWDMGPEEKASSIEHSSLVEFKRLHEPPGIFNLEDYVIFWFLGIAGLFLVLTAGGALIERRETAPQPAEITRMGRYFLGKALLWLPALIPGALIGGAVFFAPLGKPVFNLYYIGFFGGYGVLLWLLYRFGRMPGVTGKLTLKDAASSDPRGGYLAGLVFMAVLLAVSLMARSGWWYTFPLNDRFIWLLVFTPVTALGFRIGLSENAMLKAARQKAGWLLWANTLIGLLPFFLYTAFLASLGSLSGVVGSVQGLVILALAIATGSVVEKLSGRAWLAALLQAFLLYWLILPQGVLFR
jgi:pimeloyl-ACP methyl ester carboxylesterase